MHQRWIEALVVGSTIGIIVLLLKLFLRGTGYVEHTLALVGAGVAVFLIQIFLSNWLREE